MNKHITAKWLRKTDACYASRTWFETRVVEGAATDIPSMLQLLLKEDRINWAFWGMIRLMSRRQCLEYALACAEAARAAYPGRTPPRYRIASRLEEVKRYLKIGQPYTGTIVDPPHRKSDQVYLCYAVDELYTGVREVLLENLFLRTYKVAVYSSLLMTNFKISYSMDLLKMGLKILGLENALCTSDTSQPSKKRTVRTPSQSK